MNHTTYKHAKADLGKVLSDLYIVTVALLFGFTVGLLTAVVQQPEQPDCPTEDSCVVDYSDGRWTIKEVTP